jgi:hypothetical protein
MREAQRAMEAALARVLPRLPAEVRSFVADECRFLSLLGGKPYGHCADGLITLALSQLSDTEADCVVAHEIAHAWLGHGPMPDGAQRERQEREAQEQAAAWGFPDFRLSA